MLLKTRLVMVEKIIKTSDALKSIQQMLNDGAQIIDIGAESTRPGSDPITYQR